MEVLEKYLQNINVNKTSTDPPHFSFPQYGLHLGGGEGVMPSLESLIVVIGVLDKYLLYMNLNKTIRTTQGSYWRAPPGGRVPGWW